MSKKNSGLMALLLGMTVNNAFSQSTSAIDETVMSPDSDVVQSFLSYVTGLWTQFSEWDGLSTSSVIVLVLSVFVTILLAKFAEWFIGHFLATRFAHKTKSEIDDKICIALDKPAALLIYGIGAFCCFYPFRPYLKPLVYALGARLCLAWCAAAVAAGIYRLIDVVDYLLTKFAARTDNNVDDLIVAIVRKSLKIVVVSVSVVFIGQNILNLQITALLAGAGVCGLAVAFAAQDTIANFFGSIMIILDKPFRVGDRITVGGVNGTVSVVGFRSTKMVTLTGHLITVPNKEAANSVVENISERPFLKQVYNFGLVYDTTPEQMEQALSMLHTIFDDHEGMDEERKPLIVFNSFNDWSLNLMVMVWYHPADWDAFQLWNSATNMRVLREFNDAGLEFAFPTNTTYHAFDPKRKLEFGVENIS